MNRLIILGNGFDIAHGLPTSYKDFLNDFWKNISKNIEDGKVEKLLNISRSHLGMFEKTSEINSFTDTELSLKNYGSTYGYNYNLETKKLIHKTSPGQVIFEFKSEFFKVLNERNVKNWVDIEGEYYTQLKKIVKENQDKEKRLTKVKNLHKEFDNIKALLKNYLKEKVYKKYLKSDNIKINNSFYNHFVIQPLTGIDLKKYCSEFPKEDEEEIKAFNEKLKSASNKSEIENTINQNNLSFINVFLNFNYTNSIEKYKFNSYTTDYHGENRHINIHGQLKLPEDNIIFGFGDEMDDDYSTIEKLDDNEYLKNFKSFQYTLNNNYKILLDFIGSNKFQVYIMGHSCGLSDRILLNTIFEHKNCRSIKVFYRKKEDESDNYTNLVQNISRHFNDKALMRKKLVNKLLCKPLIEKKNKK